MMRGNLLPLCVVRQRVCSFVSLCAAFCVCDQDDWNWFSSCVVTVALWG